MTAGDNNPNQGINNPEALADLLRQFMNRRLHVALMPQCSDDNPWMIQVDVPTMDSEMPAYFGGLVLEDLLSQALKEYDRREVAKKVLYEKRPGEARHGNSG